MIPEEPAARSPEGVEPAREGREPDFAALRRRRVQVRRPGIAPSAEEVLLSPSRGHIAPSVEATSRVRGLMRAQLRAALIVSVGFFTVMLAVGAGGVLFRDIATATIAGIPWEWLLPGAGFFPLLLISGWWYVRTAERLERRFAADAEAGVVTKPDDD